VPGTGGVTVWYLEDGFQTTIPSDKQRFYRGSENDRYVIPPVANGSGEQRVRPDQARQLSNALKLAYCQPAVGAFFNFELMDEARLRGWQSGVLWRDGTPKPSYESFKGTIAAVKAGDVDCSTVTGGGS